MLACARRLHGSNLAGSSQGDALAGHARAATLVLHCAWLRWPPRTARRECTDGHAENAAWPGQEPLRLGGAPHPQRCANLGGQVHRAQQQRGHAQDDSRGCLPGQLGQLEAAALGLQGRRQPGQLHAARLAGQRHAHVCRWHARLCSAPPSGRLAGARRPASVPQAGTKLWQAGLRGLDHPSPDAAKLSAAW